MKAVIALKNSRKTFKMNTMKGYHGLYLKVDAFLLTCMFKNFRKESINSFELDSAYYLPTSSYICDELPRFKAVDLKLISDNAKYQFVESKIRGGISMVCKK